MTTEPSPYKTVTETANRTSNWFFGASQHVNMGFQEKIKSTGGDVPGCSTVRQSIRQG